MNKSELESLTRQCNETAQVLKLLAHPQRLLLLCQLAEGEKSVSELEETCGSSQSQISQFLQRMKTEELVTSRREGKFVYYRILDTKVLKLIQALHKIYCP